MDGSLLALMGLIVLHAMITLAYAALTNTREPLLRELTETGQDSPPRLHITYQLSLILVRFAIAAVAVTVIGPSLLVTLRITDGQVERIVAYVIVLLPTAVITLILGDFVPEAIASSRADALARWAIWPMKVLIVLLGPLVFLMTSASKGLAGIFGSSDKVNVFTEEELMTMLDASEKEGSIENDEKEMIYSVLQFGDKTVREVMIPRIDIVALDISAPLDDAINAFMASGHSRIPIYDENIDNIRGLLYAKDLLTYLRKDCDTPNPALKDIMRKAFFVPESKRADELLDELRTNMIHMAVVVDEYGGTAGIVTFEDLIEEIVGDIQDEYDIHEEADYVELGPNVYRIDAGMSLADFNDLLDLELPTDDANTLGGYLFTMFGRVPKVGETLDQDKLVVRVESLDGRRIRKVHVTRKVPPPPATEANNDNISPRPQAVTE